MSKYQKCQNVKIRDRWLVVSCLFDVNVTLIYNQKSGQFDTRKGPIFSNVILADEINRSPAKVASHPS